MDAEKKTPLTYAGVGIDFDVRQAVVKRYRDIARSASRPEVIKGVGAFGGLFALGSRYRDPVLVASTDSVGTKVKLAALVGRYEGLGHDVVNQSVNDALTTGAEPLFFLDYIASSDLDAESKVALVKGVAEACAAAGCALLGGETADMPDLYAKGEFDVAGFVVGVVERDSIIDGSHIQPGDLLFGLPSNGLHTNGYSLARPALGVAAGGDPAADREALLRFEDELGESLADALLRPHRCYLKDLRPALPLIKGMAHITGGGLQENLPRMLPEGLGARLDKGSWPVPPVFGLIRRRGGIEEEEMYHVFNMGLGMVFCVSLEQAEAMPRLVPGAVRLGVTTALFSGEEPVAWR